jgi:putative Holliday junction resolvase
MREKTPALAIDHGEKRIGLAISDTTRTIARPLSIIKHVSREHDARQILELADQSNVGIIVVGQSSDEDGLPNLAGRRAGRFAQLLSTLTVRKIVLWDESLSTRDARDWRLASGASRKKRSAAADAAAAAMILQSYLDAQRTNSGAPED